MKKLKFLVLLICFFVSSEAISKILVSKVSSSGKKVLLSIADESVEQGQTLIVTFKGKKAAIVRVAKVSKSGRKAIAYLSKGKAVRGLLAMDEFEYDTKKVARSGNNPWGDTEEALYGEYDDDYSSKKGKSRRPAQYKVRPSGHKGFASGLLGYDLEMASQFAEGGLVFGLQGAYKLKPEWAVGARFSYTNGALSGDLRNLDPPISAEINESMRLINFMVDGLYFFQPNIFFGAGLGYSSASCTTCNSASDIADSGFAFGGLAGYDYMIGTSGFAVGARAAMTYHMLEDEIGLIENIFTISLLANVSYWF